MRSLFYDLESIPDISKTILRECILGSNMLNSTGDPTKLSSEDYKVFRVLGARVRGRPPVPRFTINLFRLGLLKHLHL